MIKFPAALLGLMLLFGCTAQQSMAQEGYDDISLQSFYDELSPYGTWIQDPQYGNVWRPDVNQDDFRPYYSDGRWAMTEYGNTWVSDYDWGWAPFHYGRWVNNRFNQWVWIPDTVWGPAWVSWRSGAGYYGWAPLGPGINININIGGGGYNTPNNWWNFIPQRSIYSNNYPRYSSRNITIINRTTIINNTYGRGDRNTYYTGPRADDIRRATNRDVRVYNISRSERPGRTSISNNNINIYNPRSRTGGTSRVDNGTTRPGTTDRSGRSDANGSRTGAVDRSGRGDINTSRSGNTSTTRPDVNNPRTGSTDRSGRGDINTSRTGNTAPSRTDAGTPVSGNTDRSGRGDNNSSRAGNTSRTANPDQQRQQRDAAQQQQRDGQVRQQQQQQEQQRQQQQRDGQARQQQQQQQEQQRQQQQRDGQARQQQQQQQEQQRQQQQRDGQARQQQQQQQQQQQEQQRQQQQRDGQARQQQEQQRQQQQQQQRQQQDQQRQQQQQQQQQQRSQEQRSGGDATQRGETSRSGRN